MSSKSKDSSRWQNEVKKKREHTSFQFLILSCKIENIKPAQQSENVYVHEVCEF